MDSNLPYSEQYRLIAEEWVEAEAAAALLEDTKSAVLAKMMADLGDMPVNRAEMKVKSSTAWETHVQTITEARKRASLLKVQVEYIRMKFSEWQSHEATKRAEMRI